MSTKAVARFLVNIGKDEVQREQMQTALQESGTDAAIVEFARNAGFTFTYEEFRVTRDELLAEMKGSEQLSDEALENVTGGASDIFKAASGTLLQSLHETKSDVDALLGALMGYNEQREAISNSVSSVRSSMGKKSKWEK